MRVGNHLLAKRGYKRRGFLKYKIWFDILFKRKYNSVFNIKN